MSTTIPHTDMENNTDGTTSTQVVDLRSGPFSVLYDAVRNNTQILINVRNNHKYIGRVKAYDRHMNLYVISFLSWLVERVCVMCVVVLCSFWLVV